MRANGGQWLYSISLISFLRWCHPPHFLLTILMEDIRFHRPVCGFCGCSVNENDPASYLAIPTCHSPGTEPDGVCVNSISSGSLVFTGNPVPTFYLTHLLCLRIFRCARPDSNIPLRYVIASAGLIRDADLHNHHRLSDLDAAAMVAKFNPNVSDDLRYILNASESFHILVDRMLALPNELTNAIILQCQVDLALALTACEYHHDLFMDILRKDVVRRRVACCIEAATLLQPGLQQKLFSEKIIVLEEKMKATFVQLTGVDYLQDIGKELSDPKAFEFVIPGGRPQQLALLVDDIGIKNIAFTVNAKGRPDWIRPDHRKHNIVLDLRNFTAIRILADVSDRRAPRAHTLIYL
jgi:hypothetical protein